MSDRMSQEQWKKFCDPSKNPKIFAYLQASGKDFEQTRKDFNAAARKESVKVTINGFMLFFTISNGLLCLSHLFKQEYSLMMFNLSACVLCGLSAATIKGNRGATKKALVERANQYAQTGHYRPYL